MNLFSVSQIKTLLNKYNTKPIKYFGQNFLISKSVLNKIIKTAELTKKDIVLEVGPGIGTLTQELAKRAKKVIAIEKDKTMVQILKETLKDYKNVDIINNDILKILNLKSEILNYKVVANIPYYLTSPLIRKFLESENQPSSMVLMAQKEVGQRICSMPPHMNLLAVSVQFYAEAKIISYVSKKCFWPSPKVDSAIIKMEPRINTDRKQINTDLFFKIVKAGFSHPRKQLVNNLSVLKTLNGVKLDKHKITEWLLKNNIKPTQRAETLNVNDWMKLTIDLKELWP